MTIRSIKFTPEVLLSAPRRSAGIPNAKGTLALYTQSTYSFDTHSKTSEIRLLDISTGNSTVLTDDAGASNPQWLDDGEGIVWLQEKDNGNTSFVIRENGQIYTAGTVSGPVSNLKVTALGGGKIGFAVSGQANPDGSLYNPKDAKTPLSSARLYTKAWVRHWDTWVTPQKNSIWYGQLQRLPSSSKYTTSAITNLLKVTMNPELESPIPPFGGTDHFDICSQAIIFIAKAADDVATHTRCDLYWCPMFSWTEAFTPVGIKSVRTMGFNLSGAMASPVISPDGDRFAFLAMKEDGYEADKNRLVFVEDPFKDNGVFEVFESSNGQGAWDLSPSSIIWGRDSSLLYLLAEETGRESLYQLPTENIKNATPKSLKKLTKSGSVAGVYPASKTSDKLFVSSTSLVENSLFSIVDPSDADKVEIVSSTSRGGAACGLSPSQIDEIWWKGANDHPVHAWVVKPSNFDPKVKYPLSYLIHGGPQGAWNDQWSTRWNPAVFAEQGYVVVMPNPTGSTGYGQAFTDGIKEQWGGLPYEDLVKGFEYLEKSVDYVDTDRAVALGASYGGYMMNWIQGHDLGRRFLALVTHDGVFSMTSQLASEELYFPLHDMGGPLWKVPENWEKWDPSRFTQNWQTPHLIIHNELDYRLTIAEGLAAFNVLQARGVDSAFLSFPDENHWVLKPENSLVWHKTVINWINKYAGLPQIKDKDGN